jgi:hypothetical protein
MDKALIEDLWARTQDPTRIDVPLPERQVTVFAELLVQECLALMIASKPRNGHHSPENVQTDMLINRIATYCGIDQVMNVNEVWDKSPRLREHFS